MEAKNAPTKLAPVKVAPKSKSIKIGRPGYKVLLVYNSVFGVLILGWLYLPAGDKVSRFADQAKSTDL